jgi:hypothetical protein
MVSALRSRAIISASVASDRKFAHLRCHAANRGQFYFAWGCFRDFVSSLRCGAEEYLHRVQDT